MFRFVDRQEELSFLERSYQGGGFNSIPVYGCRRIGKTRLVQEFIKDKPAVQN